MITINGQEYHLQLVDTAGQVCIGPLLLLTLLLLRNYIRACFFLMSLLWVVYDSKALPLTAHVFCQDEYSIFPQTYSIDINGYILVYSVTSNKRLV